VIVKNELTKTETEKVQIISSKNYKLERLFSSYQVIVIT